MSGNRAAFQGLAEPYRRELQVHCYRMLGSLQDAEDLVQETFLRAWRGFDQFEGHASFRNWLYTIATNACLNALARNRRVRRVLPEAQGTPAEQPREGAPATELAWLDPYPDAWLEGIADAAPGPEARIEQREAVQLAFVAAIQHLPPRQRAVLLLRDVLGWRAGETAGLLGASVASVNSALQRARATLAQRFPGGEPRAESPPDARQRALLNRYVRAWESADLDGFVALLREDAVLSMPPSPHWYRGRGALRTFIGWAWQQPGNRYTRLVPTAANRQPAFAQYVRGADERRWQAHAIWIPTIRTTRSPSCMASWNRGSSPPSACRPSCRSMEPHHSRWGRKGGGPMTSRCKLLPTCLGGTPAACLRMVYDRWGLRLQYPQAGAPWQPHAGCPRPCVGRFNGAFMRGDGA